MLNHNYISSRTMCLSHHSIQCISIVQQCWCKPKKWYLFMKQGSLLALLSKARDIVFTFIIEYNSLRDFGPKAIGLFLCEDFWMMIFWLVLKLEISYNRVMISYRILVSCRKCFWRLYFCMVKYLRFHNSSFDLRYFLM
jgi:hypothetical protein